MQGATMDDCMREMVDLKTLVTKTLEKKGVLARIRAELRANVFQAMEEQDHEAESNGSTTFSLLGTCNERAKKFHTSSSGKVLMALVCEYMEWCELEHTLKVYMPDLNQPRAYNRPELEEILGLVGESKPDNDDSRPLLMTIVESFLKEKKNTCAPQPVAQAKPTRHGVAGGSRQLSGNLSNVVDPSEALEARVSMTNKKLSEKPVGSSHKSPFQSRSESDRGANDGTISPKLYDDSHKVYEKSSNRAQALLADLPQHRRSSGLPAFTGVSRTTPNSRGSSNGSSIDQQSAVPGVDTGVYPKGSRDKNNDAKSTWRDQDYGENPSKTLGNLHLDDGASEFEGYRSSGSRGTPTGQQWQAGPRENVSPAPSAGNKKQASAHFYSDSEEENAPE